MSFDQFIRFLQSLLTMVSKNNTEESIKKGTEILHNLYNLALSSHTADMQTTLAIRVACGEFEYLAYNADQFAGVPGQYSQNQAKRQRLSMVVTPHC